MSEHTKIIQAGGFEDSTLLPASSAPPEKCADAPDAHFPSGAELGAPAAAETFPPPLADPDALHTFVRDMLGASVARTPLTAGARAPFEYLVHSFFEGAFEPQQSAAGREITWRRRGDGEPRPPGDTVVWANRGGGKTYLGAIATVLDMVFKCGIQVRLLAGSLQQGRLMFTHVQGFLEKQPFASMLK